MIPKFSLPNSIKHSVKVEEALIFVEASQSGLKKLGPVFIAVEIPL